MHDERPFSVAAQAQTAMNATSLADTAIGLAELGWVPDAAIRVAIRRLCRERLASERARRGKTPDAETTQAFLRSLRAAEVAPLPAKANAQHYEVPAALFRLMLGPRLKYSCCWWGWSVETLAQAEEASLAITAERADLRDGQQVLELGCGWGSLSLWMAERFPNSRILAVSNSRGQRAYIEQEARQRGLRNLDVRTADMNTFDAGGRFDRVVSVEMFEHIRNHHALLARIGTWLEKDGRLFVHVFCHQRFAYLFEEEGAGDWMGRHFFSGGMMPSLDLLPGVPSPLALEQQWTWDGTHYARTANAWLDEALHVLARAYGKEAAPRWLGRWRIFLMACAELFAYRAGDEWGVAHYRWVARQDPQAEAAS
jgi:cyclopropane-fatty-acyl-phospholipid synthase